MRRDDILRSYLLYYLLYKRRYPRCGNTVLLYAVADVLKPYIRSYVSSNTCPYCLRVFTTRMSLRKHLRYGFCGQALKLDIEDVVKAYTALHVLLASGGSGVWIRGTGLRFKNKAELAEFLRKSGELLKVGEWGTRRG